MLPVSRTDERRRTGFNDYHFCEKSGFTALLDSARLKP